MVETVKFNVGGRHFEVSRALIDAHSDTMLGKLVSDTWNEDPDKPVFVDRDGDIFAQVLNYLRYGSIELPMTIPRSAFDRECDYYGISADASVVAQDSLASTIESLVAPVAEATKNHHMFLFALECYNQFCEKRPNTPSPNPVMVIIDTKHSLYGKLNESLKKACNRGGDERRVFGTYLERYFGLAVYSSGNVNGYAEYGVSGYRVYVVKK